VEVICAAKGGGSEAKSKFAMLNPSDDLVDWVLKKIPEMGAGWCPPGIIGIGIGGTPGKSHAAGQGIDHGAGGHP
jgi:fumarate hydratase class I